jgi:hypothetical protein
MTHKCRKVFCLLYGTLSCAADFVMNMVWNVGLKSEQCSEAPRAFTRDTLGDSSVCCVIQYATCFVLCGSRF